MSHLKKGNYQGEDLKKSEVGAILSKPIVKIAPINTMLHVFLGIP